MLKFGLGKTKYDAIQRDVLENKPVLMWSFNDNLNYKLEFESTLEVVSLSFCPYDPNVLVGGATNGQIILWDLQNRADNLDIEEMLSSAQITYRVLMNEFLKWTIEINEEILVPPATVSGLEYSQRATITSIQWLASNTFVNTFGKVSTVPLGSARYRFFMTTSLDGTIAFWNLDAQTGRKVASTVRRDLPAILTQSESAYKGKILIPIFSVAFNEPITSIVADTPVFKFKIKDKFIKNEKNRYNYAIRLEENNLPEVRQSCVISSLYGRIERLLWLGLYADADGREIINTSVNFARVHDGPVISMKKNPFYPWLFVSIGRTIFAVWKEDYNYSPIFWRKRKCDLTAVAWSESRPSVLFLTRIDGTIEAWDILCK